MERSAAPVLCYAAMLVTIGHAAIVTSQISDLVPFQERCDASGTGVGCSGVGVDDNAPALSFLELNGQGFQTPSCEWTVYYDTWVPTFEKGEYEHPWEGGHHCLEACCRDPKCNSLQLLSSELFQCYKYNKPPAIKGKEGKLLGDAKWLLTKKRAWSVFVKGHPAEVAARLAAASPSAEYSSAGPSLAASGELSYAGASPTSDAFTWLSRIGVVVVLAAIVVRIMSETTVKAVAKLKFGAGAESNERLSLLAHGK